jgi:hypothetical protein
VSASADDRQWFARHPARNHRLRLPFEEERVELQAAPPGCVTLIVVRQVCPGSRLRVGVLVAEDQLSLLNSEAESSRLFALYSRDYPQTKEAEAAMLQGCKP